MCMNLQQELTQSQRSWCCSQPLHLSAAMGTPALAPKRNPSMPQVGSQRKGLGWSYGWPFQLPLGDTIDRVLPVYRLAPSRFLSLFVAAIGLFRVKMLQLKEISRWNPCKLDAAKFACMCFLLLAIPCQCRWETKLLDRSLPSTIH